MKLLRYLYFTFPKWFLLVSYMDRAIFIIIIILSIKTKGLSAIRWIPIEPWLVKVTSTVEKFLLSSVWLCNS